MKHLKPLSSTGFTLIELLVTIGITAFIMLLVATIFNQSATTYITGVDRMNIYSSARSAIDLLASDLNGCFSLEGNRQKFTFSEDKEGDDIAEARDRISFHGIVLVQQQVTSAKIEYYLVQDKDYTILDAQGGTITGLAKTTKTKRQLYVMRREAKDINTGALLDSVDLCHFVLSFNIEVFDRPSRSFKQLSGVGYNYPIGDGAPPDEKLPSGLRITVRVVANAAERQERIISRVIWLPMGG
jgi:type II secretory pathway pseudopilin PulG